MKDPHRPPVVFAAGYDRVVAGSALDSFTVGDRRFDITAAAAHRITPVGVLRNYGCFEELLSAGAIH